MARDSNIPLFLWIATAALTHLLWAGGADRVVSLLERRMQLHSFLLSVDRRAKRTLAPVEVTLEPTQPADEEEAPDDKPEELERNHELEPKPDPAIPEPPEPADPEVESPPKLVIVKKPKEDKKRERLELLDEKRRRIAVVQHVEDKNQQDNPDAEFLGEHANRVKEQTQARITSTDQNDADPTPGSSHSGPLEFPGNSSETRVAQSTDSPGKEAIAPDPVSGRPQPTRPAQEASTKPAQQPRPARAEATPARRAVPQTAQRQVVRPPAVPQSSSPSDDALTSQTGPFSLAKRRAVERERSPSHDPLAPRRRAKPDPLKMLGLGAEGTTDRGVNLNLTPVSALAAVGVDTLVRERRRDAERRLSEHRGSWKSVGIERWRSAIENYVPNVKLGNATALNTARSPFAAYLNQIHNRLHPIFADTFLMSLSSLPSSHPMNQPDLKTSLEIVVGKEDGRLVRMGVTRTSGVTAYDIGALESVQRASPFGPPPSAIVSPDGNAYLHWEFHRNPIYACSTYFARPYILKSKPKTAPPDVQPQPEPDLEPSERPPSDPRHGYLRVPAARRTSARWLALQSW